MNFFPPSPTHSNIVGFATQKHFDPEKSGQAYRYIISPKSTKQNVKKETINESGKMRLTQREIPKKLQQSLPQTFKQFTLSSKF
jgi:isopropylmalate/homocitrate/citramalate synthase